MCTLTYIPLMDRLLVCSNRDEVPNRSQCELIKTPSGLLYPKEPLKGGTWICANNQRILVLLNGAFEKHQPSTAYTKSRGLLLLELSNENNPIKSLKSLELSNVEPFTLVSIQKNKVEEVRWTGEEILTKSKDPNNTHIWSSATLYSKQAQDTREHLFENFINTKELNSSSQWDFHTTPSNDLENGIVISRPNGPQTISTTQIILGDTLEKFKYYDHLQDLFVHP